MASCPLHEPAFVQICRSKTCRGVLKQASYSTASSRQKGFGFGGCKRQQKCAGRVGIHSYEAIGQAEAKCSTQSNIHISFGVGGYIYQHQLFECHTSSLNSSNTTHTLKLSWATTQPYGPTEGRRSLVPTSAYVSRAQRLPRLATLRVNQMCGLR